MEKTAKMAGAATAMGDFGPGSLIIIFLIATVYFVPSFFAITRRHFNAMPIFLTNLYLGWTIIGWIVALIWAFTQHMITESPVVAAAPQPRPVTPPKPVKTAASSGAGGKMLKAALWIFAVLGGLFILSIVLATPDGRQAPVTSPSSVKSGKPVPADELFK